MVYLQYEPGYNHANYGIFVVYVIYILHITGIYAVYIQYILKHPWLIQGYSYFFFNSGQSRDTRRLVPNIRRQTRRIRPARHGVRTPGLHPELPKAKNIQRFSKPMHTLVTSSVSWITRVEADNNSTVQSKAVLLQLGVSRMEKRIICGPVPRQNK